MNAARHAAFGKEAAEMVLANHMEEWHKVDMQLKTIETLFYI